MPVAHSQRTASTASNWHLFNDFLVRPMRREDALNFSTTWKLPSIIAYQLKKGNNHIDDSWKDNLDTSLLHTDNALVLALLSVTTYSTNSILEGYPQYQHTSHWMLTRRRLQKAVLLRLTRNSSLYVNRRSRCPFQGNE